jgi:hypothetical protein
MRVTRASRVRGINILVLKPLPPVLKSDCFTLGAMTTFRLKRLTSWRNLWISHIQHGLPLLLLSLG